MPGSPHNAAWGELARLGQLLREHDFAALVAALAGGTQPWVAAYVPPGGRPPPPDFFPAWIRRAGGYFPKFARVLRQLGRCREDMPARGEGEVRAHLRRCGGAWGGEVAEAYADAVGLALAAGTIAQVNAAGARAVVKCVFQMRNDFLLFRHAARVLGALRLDDRDAHAVSAMFAAVHTRAPLERAVMREFDLRAGGDEGVRPASLAVMREFDLRAGGDEG
eukprot:gene21007-29341_t